MTKPITWTDEGGCSSCKFCGMDMDMSPYCVHPEVTRKWTSGLVINRAIAEYCGDNLRLRMERRT